MRVDPDLAIMNRLENLHRKNRSPQVKNGPVEIGQLISNLRGHLAGYTVTKKFLGGTLDDKINQEFSLMLWELPMVRSVLPLMGKIQGIIT